MRASSHLHVDFRYLNVNPIPVGLSEKVLLFHPQKPCLWLFQGLSGWKSVTTADLRPQGLQRQTTVHGFIPVTQGAAGDDDNLECSPTPLPFWLSINLGKQSGF